VSQVPPPAVGYQAPPPPGAGKPQTLAVVSLICGIVSFLTCWIPIGPITLGLLAAIGAIVTGFMAKAAIKRGEQAGNGLATAGIILGIVHIALWLIILVLATVFGIAIMKFGQKMQEEAERQQQQGTTPATAPVELFRMSLDYVTTVARHLLQR
jgi:hypothetical protein